MATKHIITNEELQNTVGSMLQLAMQQPGVTDVEVGGAVNSGLMARVRLGEVDVIEFHRDKSLGITVYKGQCKGAASITDLTPAAVEAAVQAACRIAEYTQADPAAGLPEKELLIQKVTDLDLYHPEAITPEQALEYAKECESAALSVSKEIINSEGGVFSVNDQFYVQANSRGLFATYPTTKFSAYCVVIGQRMDSMQRDYDFTVARNVHELDKLAQIGKSAAEKTLAKLGARKIKTCQAPVMFTSKVAGSFWSTLIAAISGSNLFRQSSFLLDRLHTQVFPEFVNISEQPHIPRALGSAPFDDEGVATRNKDIIKAGMLKSYLLSCYSARKLGLQTTANAGGVHNLVVQGTLEFQAILKQMQRGLLVTELMGNGTNIVTGDYSHGAAGFWVENGEIAYPVEEITIAGNLKDMYNNVIAIGNDVDLRSNIRTGSVLLQNMTIAGS